MNAECINEQGSFLCQCRDGYTGDGKICEGINKFTPISEA